MQCVRYNATLPDFATLHAGLPQGTKLGPICFQVIINDAVQNISGPISCWKCVDDLTIAENRTNPDSSQLQVILDSFSLDLPWPKPSTRWGLCDGFWSMMSCQVFLSLDNLQASVSVLRPLSWQSHLTQSSQRLAGLPLGLCPWTCDPQHQIWVPRWAHPFDMAKVA